MPIGSFEAGTSPAVSDLQDRRDRELLDRTAEGSEDAFSELYRRYSPAALGLALRVLGQRSLAEDALQEVFVTVWRQARTYDPARGRVRTWILTQIHHRAVDAVRREEAERRRHSVEDLPARDEISDIIEEGWIAARRAQVRAALAALPVEQRQAVELAYFGGLTQSQISRQTGTPLGTVKTRTMSAMRRLRDALAGGET